MRKLATPSKRNPSLQGGRSFFHQRWQKEPSPLAPICFPQIEGAARSPFCTPACVASIHRAFPRLGLLPDSFCFNRTHIQGPQKKHENIQKGPQQRRASHPQPHFSKRTHPERREGTAWFRAPLSAPCRLPPGKPNPFNVEGTPPTQAQNSKCETKICVQRSLRQKSYERQRSGTRDQLQVPTASRSCNQCALRNTSSRARCEEGEKLPLQGDPRFHSSHIPGNQHGPVSSLDSGRFRRLQAAAAPNSGSGSKHYSSPCFGLTEQQPHCAGVPAYCTTRNPRSCARIPHRGEKSAV